MVAALGLDKLGRAWNTDKGMVTKKLAMIAAFSVFLAMLNDDDDDYDGLPDWEKDAYWHVFPPGLDGEKIHIRIPKPFEIGFLAGTMPERMWRAWVTESQPSKKVIWSLQHGIRETLNINIYPQFLLPVAELKANRHFYFDQPIESLADQSVISSRRFNMYTSEAAIIAGNTALAKWLEISPKQLQHVWNGYTGTMGAYALSAADIVLEKTLDFPTPEEIQLEDIPLIKSIYKGQRERTTQWQTDIYDRLQEVQQLYGTVRKYRQEGDADKALKFFVEEKDKIKYRKVLERARQAFSLLNKRRGQILRDDRLKPSEKYQKSQAIQHKISAIAQKIEKLTRAGWSN